MTKNERLTYAMQSGKEIRQMAANGFSDPGDRAWQVLVVWGVFIAFAVVVNATIPFAFGEDVRAWTYSATKSMMFHLVGYGLLFMIVPLILTKGKKQEIAHVRGFRTLLQ